MKEKKMSDLNSRALTLTFSSIIVAIFIFFAEFALFRPVFTAGIGCIAAVALWEYYQLVRKKDLAPAVLIGIITAVLYVFAVFFKTGTFFDGPIWENLPPIILGLSFFACFVFYSISGKEPILNLSTTFFGLLYIVIPLACFVRIAYFFLEPGASDQTFEGSFWLFYLIAVTKASDLGGYFIGRWFGKKKLAVRLSPNKTYEGAIAGFVLSILMSLFIVYLGKKIGAFEYLSYASPIWLGAILGIFGQLGDLSESLLKRDAATKDSNVIPGVGGILDMVDSLLFNAPIVYIFLNIGL